MSEEFIPNSEIYSAPPGSSAPIQPSREPIHITIVGSAISIDLVVKILHRLGFAEARAWSKLQNDPNTGRPMRVLTKWLRYCATLIQPHPIADDLSLGGQHSTDVPTQPIVFGAGKSSTCSRLTRLFRSCCPSWV
ncbi:MAG: hypothetical protein WBB18_16595 [Nodosilinea sp.]